MPSPSDNTLLAHMSPRLQTSITPQLAAVSLGAKQMLWEAHEPIHDVYFPVTAVCSLVSVMSDGKIAEIATVGREGMMGGDSVMGMRSLPFRGINQVPGAAYVMPLQQFESLFRTDPGLRLYLERYMRAYFVQVGQSGACNSVHDVTRRCARWLLLTHDRASSDEFKMTHDLLAEMLGVRRATVTQAASELQRRGLIEYRRGHVRIADREGLVDAACECYGVIRTAYDEVGGYPDGSATTL
jgi:CRP-like cAMP-binding protein